MVSNLLRSKGIIFLFLLIIGYPIAAETPGFPPLTPSAEAVGFSQEIDLSDWKTLVSLASWASGATDRTGEITRRLVPAVDELENMVTGLDERTAAEKVLEYMHRNFLTAYSLRQTRLDSLIDTGKYNCVSSAVLYAILGTAVGLDISGVMTVDHAFCSVKIGDRDADVETTSLYGFDPGTKTEFQNAFGETTGFVYVPPRNYRDRTGIDLLTLFSLILSNRMSDDEAARNYSEAVSLAVDRWVLLGRGTSGKAYEDLVDRMINYGVYLSSRGKEEDALNWANLASSTIGNHRKWQDFTDSAANNLVVRLLRRGMTAEARTRFDEARPRLSEKTASKLDLSISDAELLDALKAVQSGGDEAAFYAVMANAEKQGVLPAERIREVDVVWQLQKIEKTAKEDGWAAAAKETELAITETGPDSRLENALRVYRANHLAELYNAAAAAYNSQNFSEALKLADEAITEFPGDSRLQKLRTAAEKAVSGN